MTGVLEAERTAHQSQHDVDVLLLKVLRDIIVRGHAKAAEVETLREIASGSFLETAEVATRTVAWIASARRRGVLNHRGRPPV